MRTVSATDAGDTHATGLPRSAHAKALLLMVALGSLLAFVATIGVSGRDARESAVVLVETYRGDDLLGRGYGVVVSPRLVVSCLHVVSEGDRAVVVSRRGARIEIDSVTGFDVRRDLVALRMSRDWTGRMVPRSAKVPSEGEPVQVVIYSRWNGVSGRSDAVVLAHRKLPAEGNVNELDFESTPGTSGAPVSDKAGRLCAIMVSGGGHRSGYAVPLTDWTPNGPARPLAEITALQDPWLVANRWRRKGDAHRDSDRYAQAVDCYGNALFFNPRDWRAMNAMAWCFTQMEDMPRALAWRKRLIALMPDEPEFWAIYALELLIAENRVEALDAARRAESVCPSYAVDCLHMIRYVYEQLLEIEAAHRIDVKIDGRPNRRSKKNRARPAGAAGRANLPPAARLVGPG